MIFSQLRREALSRWKYCPKPAVSNFKPNMHGNSQHPAVVRSLRSQLCANGRVMVHSIGREEDYVRSWNLKKEDSSLAYPERSNTVTPRNLNPNSKFQLQLRLMCKQNRDDFFTSGSQCSVSLNPTTKPAQ